VADFEVSPPTYCDFEEQLDIKKDKSPMATLGPSIRRLLRRTFRWVSIIRRMDVFEDSEKSISTEPIHKTNDFKEIKNCTSSARENLKDSVEQVPEPFGSPRINVLGHDQGGGLCIEHHLKIGRCLNILWLGG
jgi:hypothetical protein